MKNLEAHQIKTLAWLKNNEEWFYPVKRQLWMSLKAWDSFEVLHYYNDDNFLVYAWNDNEPKAEGGKLFICEKISE